MNIQVNWRNPIPLTLKKAKGYDKPNAMKNAVKRDVAERIKDGYGVYIFARRHGANYAPLYVGRTTQQGFCARIAQHLNTLDFVGHLLKQRGKKVLILGVIVGKRGQNLEKSIKIVEKALITKCALDAGHNLFNKKNTKKEFHKIAFSGKRAVKKMSGYSIEHPM